MSIKIKILYRVITVSNFDFDKHFDFDLIGSFYKRKFKT